MSAHELLTRLVEAHGYAAVFVGTVLEGETIMVIAGFLSQRGYLDLRLVVALGALGSLCGDQFWYLLGRSFGERILARRPGWRPAVARARGLLESRGWLVILGFRFLYGIRTVTPFVIGMTRVPVRRFLPLDALGAVAWTALVAGLGHGLGPLLARALGRFGPHEHLVVLGIALVGLLVWAWLLLRRRRAAAELEKQEARGAELNADR